MANQNRNRRTPDDVIREAMRRGDIRPGEAYVIDVQHESHCRFLSGNGPCNCQPEVHLPKRIPNPEDN